MVHKIFSKSTRQVALMVKLRKTDQNYSTTKSNTKLAFPSLICGFWKLFLHVSIQFTAGNGSAPTVIWEKYYKKKIRNIHILATMVLAYNMLLRSDKKKSLLISDYVSWEGIFWAVLTCLINLESLACLLFANLIDFSL